MKKIVMGFFSVFLGLLFILNVNASSMSASLSGSSSFENEITLKLRIGQLKDFDGSCEGLCGFVGTLEYDNSKIEMTSISALNNFDLTSGKKVVLYRATGVSSGTDILTIKFKNKSLKNNESTNIVFSNVVVSDGDHDITSGNISKTIKYVEKENEPSNEEKDESSKPVVNNPSSSNGNKTNNTGGNKTNTKKPTTSSNNATAIVPKKSDNNYLKELSLSDGRINFSKDVLTYDVVVGYEVMEITVNGALESDKASIDGIGVHKLEVGSNPIKITVKAEDSSERVYIINVNREKENIVVKEEEPTVENKQCTFVNDVKQFFYKMT